MPMPRANCGAAADPLRDAVRGNCGLAGGTRRSGGHMWVVLDYLSSNMASRYPVRVACEGERMRRKRRRCEGWVRGRGRV